MAKVRLRASTKAIEQAKSSGDFEPVPVGLYLAELVSVEPRFTKGDDGKPDKSRPYLNTAWKVTAKGRTGEEPLPEGTNYGRVYDVVSFGESSEWKVAQFCLTIGARVKNGEVDDEVEIEENKPGTIIGTKAVIRVKADKDLQGNYKPAVGFTGPIDGTKGDSTSSAFADDPGEDSTPDPFSDDDAAEGVALFTNEMLEDEDLKSLGAILKENFEGDPKEHIVKTRAGNVDQAKTKDAVIKAILEAQDESVEASDEEDPF